MKKICLLLVVSFFLHYLCACGKNEDFALNDAPDATRQSTGTTMPKENLEMIEGYIINNLALTEDDTAYPLKKLKDFFENSDSQTPRTLDSINDMFPITHLRCADNTSLVSASKSYYIAYPVAEGGTYIVFLLSILTDTGTSIQNRIAGETMYVNNLPNSESLEVESLSTYEDLLKVAPCTILSVVVSSGPCSYSLLEGEKVLVCGYGYGQEQELTIMEKMIVPLGESVFRNMVLSDLQ